VSIGSAIGQYLITGALFSVLDVLWLGLLAKEFHRRTFADPLAEKASRAATVFYYAVLIAFLVYFVTGPSIEDDKFWSALIGGAVVGLVAFAGSSVVNVMARKNYPRKAIPFDVAWGAVASAVACGGTYAVWQWFG
jgi:uncharacterized membrane protein